jgi:phosphate:Na+ symporter
MLAEQALELMHKNLISDPYQVDLEQARETENQIDRLRDQLKQDHLDALKEEKYSHPTGIVYSELVTQCEKIGDYALNVSEALAAIR